MSVAGSLKGSVMVHPGQRHRSDSGSDFSDEDPLLALSFDTEPELRLGLEEVRPVWVP